MSTPREYDRSRRVEAARLTRRRILEAARRQFLAHGYHGTSVADLARAAGVSPQTIYNSLGAKAQVLKAVYDMLLAGDDEPIAMNDRPEIARVRRQRSLPATLRAYAAVSATIVGRVGPLIGVVLADGAGPDADLRSFLATIDSERRVGNSGVVQHAADRFGLPEGVSRHLLVDHVWTLTSAETADRLVRRCGWSLASYERWLAASLVSGLRILPGLQGRG
jgi:AcrR family transcriptional regulator